ncbi:hypothetical protein RG47T_0533 [Mucilaginibacter polytrichastri]|uniref:Uncharacterized protein n=1 Tax=Mucilaginibacter polytrichastri TaxID=1302689 RepID=A0A1Q5ZTK1_9SPHI|nr:hypothetical protein RG47T_0533 [Mucilaginibacter polytrichastri]
MMTIDGISAADLNTFNMYNSKAPAASQLPKTGCNETL